MSGRDQGFIQIQSNILTKAILLLRKYFFFSLINCFARTESQTGFQNQKKRGKKIFLV